jgi:hypothetical protein
LDKNLDLGYQPPKTSPDNPEVHPAQAPDDDDDAANTTTNIRFATKEALRQWLFATAQDGTAPGLQATVKAVRYNVKHKSNCWFHGWALLGLRIAPW